MQFLQENLEDSDFGDFLFDLVGVLIGTEWDLLHESLETDKVAFAPRKADIFKGSGGLLVWNSLDSRRFWDGLDVNLYFLVGETWFEVLNVDLVGLVGVVKLLDLVSNIWKGSFNAVSELVDESFDFVPILFAECSFGHLLQGDEAVGLRFEGRRRGECLLV